MLSVKTRDELLEWVVKKSEHLLRERIISMPAVKWNGMCSGGGTGDGGDSNSIGNSNSTSCE